MLERKQGPKMWDDNVNVAVLKTYLSMALTAKSEAVFKAAVKLVCEFEDETDYLGEQGK